MAREGDWVITETTNPTIMHFAMGGSCEVLEIFPGERDTEKGKRRGFILRPLNDWRHIYRTQYPKDLIQSGDWFFWECDPKYVIWLNESPKTRRLFVCCDYLGNPRFLDESHRLSDIQIKNQDGIIIKLKEENERQAKAFKGVVEQSLIVEIRKVIEETMNRKIGELIATIKGRREQ